MNDATTKPNGWTGERLAWEGGKCQVPMWIMGSPAGVCNETAFGPQYPADYLIARGHIRESIPYCHGPCCPSHLGPNEGYPIIFQDGYTNEGRQMWCAVMPDFENLQESEAGFDGNPVTAVAKLRAALAKARAALSAARGGV